MSVHVTTTIRACFAALRQIRSVWRSVHWCRMPCWHWSGHWSRRCSTFVVWRWLVCLDCWCNGYGLCWTPPLTSVLGEEIRTHNSTSPRTSLVESPGEDPIPVVCSDSSVSAWCGTALPRREVLQLTTEVDARCRLRSASTSTLIVLSTRPSTLGDRAFPVAAARAWNTLPASVRSTPSLAGFRQQLKPTLFQASYP